jgi:glucose-6-phosphate isomerase
MDIAAGLGFDGPTRRIQAAQRSFPGNRPSVTLAWRKLTPFTLGQIIALHEHRVLVEGTIWGINSFDQWGVELGKELATGLLPMIRGQDAAGKDPSTRALIAKLSR